MDVKHELVQLSAAAKSGTQNSGVSQLSAENPRDSDASALARLGKRQVLKRNFGFMSMVSFSGTILGTWEGVLVLFTAGFTNGGPAGLAYGFLVVWAGTLSIFLTIAELASLAPTAAGQYHWVSILAPRPAKNFLSYVIGWLTVLAWQSIVASGAYLSGSMIQGLVILNYSSYTPQPWHGTLLFWAVLLICVFVNTVVSSILPQIEIMILMLHVFGFFAILITISYMAPHASASDVFTVFLNEGDWSSQGLSFMIGLTGLSFAFVGADAAVHMSEEIENPSLTVPRSIITSILLNGFLGFGILMATLFGIGDLNNVLKSPTNFPFVEIFLQATRSIPGTTAMTSIVITLAVSSTIGCVATSSRMTWSFARDRGLPFSSILSKVEHRSSIPLYSIAVTTVLACLLSLVNLGSSTVLNDVLSLSIAGFYATYFMCCLLLLWRRCTGTIEVPSAGEYSASKVDIATGETILVWGPWRIPGALGIINNAFACGYTIVIWLFSFFPPTNPTTASTMNYASLVTGSVILFSIPYYLVWGRKQYKGPVVEIIDEH